MASLSESEAWARFVAAPVAILATIDPGGRPQQVPIVFAVVDRVVVTAVDQKPKRSPRLARLANIEADPRVNLLVEHYSTDWDELWWVRVDGDARVVDRLDDHHLAALVSRYPPYRDNRPSGAGIVIRPSRCVGWSAT